MIVCASYGEGLYAEIGDKLEKVSRKNKAWSTRKLETGRETFIVQSAHNPTTDEIREEMSQMIDGLGLALKHVTGGA